MLVGRGHDLVVTGQLEAGEHDVAPIGRRRGERDLLGRDADERRDVRSQLLARVEHAHEPLVAATPLL